MTELSPAALAVMTAGTMGNHNMINDPVYRQCIGAALRAAADQVVPEEESCEGGFSDSLEHQCRASERRLARAELLAIAAELKGGND